MLKTETKYLVLGSGAAGVYAAKAIRSHDPDGRLVIVSREHGFPYKRPMLSKSPLLTLRQRNLDLFDESWFNQNKIEFLPGLQVLSLETANKCVRTDKGTVCYEKCIYALGGSNFIPPFPGRNLPGVFTVRTAEDLRTLKRFSVGATKAVVIGGGVIGLEMALEMEKYGLDITILEAMPRLMPRQLDEETSAGLLELLKDKFKVYTDVTITQISGEEQVSSVVLADGREFSCDLVVVSCGQKPCIEVAQKAGITCERSVVVNNRMETSAADVWACGDCAQWNGMNVALWSQAMTEGTTAGINAAGGCEKIQHYDCSLILNGGAASLFALGDLGTDHQKEYTCRTEHRIYDSFAINSKPGYAVERRFYCNGHLTGGCILGDLSGMETLKQELMEDVK